MMHKGKLNRRGRKMVKIMLRRVKAELDLEYFSPKLVSIVDQFKLGVIGSVTGFTIHDPNKRWDIKA